LGGVLAVAACFYLGNEEALIWGLISHAGNIIETTSTDERVKKQISNYHHNKSASPLLLGGDSMPRPCLDFHDKNFGMESYYFEVLNKIY